MNPAGVLTERPKLERARRPTYLLSGLLRCACCGASYTLINKTRYGYAGARNKGAAVCTNCATIGRAEVEERVLSGLKQRLLAPDLLAQFAEEYRKAFNDAAVGACQDRQKAERSLKKVESRIANILTAIEDGMYSASMKDKMSELEGEKARLEALITDNPPPPCPEASSEPVGSVPGADRGSCWRFECTGSASGGDGVAAGFDFRSADGSGRCCAGRPSA
ncbi:zinc ribbon domain-containing protein [Leisingera sp. ANG-Vp]|uniref:zinc ribbon domain-containing protein n=1 Tax=Leisingera sp. ANG-Vp TaxID=1577896 RepID=UPI00057DE084|nr:zinc ribbon domain-containing protein [Leisingera sp. ANG-Vp]KIC20415.1 hypothetical protein RA20_08675 [Leisingera sp. ANG-Vp]